MACAAAEARPDRPELPLRTPRSRSSRSRPPALVRLLYPIDEEDAGSDERQEKSPVVTSAPGLRHVQELEGHQEALRARASALRHALAQPHRRQWRLAPTTSSSRGSTATGTASVMHATTASRPRMPTRPTPTGPPRRATRAPGVADDDQRTRPSVRSHASSRASAAPSRRRPRLAPRRRRSWHCSTRRAPGSRRRRRAASTAIRAGEEQRFGSPYA